MSHWNYRVIYGDGEFWLAEVYYEGDEPVAYSDPVPMVAESIKELDYMSFRLYSAFYKPMLEAW